MLLQPHVVLMAPFVLINPALCKNQCSGGRGVRVLNKYLGFYSGVRHFQRKQSLEKLGSWCIYNSLIGIAVLYIYFQWVLTRIVFYFFNSCLNVANPLVFCTSIKQLSCNTAVFVQGAGAEHTHSCSFQAFPGRIPFLGGPVLPASPGRCRVEVHAVLVSVPVIIMNSSWDE